jgi:hypothetical protein
MFMEVDWDGNLIWKAEVPYQWHDFQPMANGHIIFNSIHPDGTLPDEFAARVKGGLPGTELNGKITGDSLVEIDRSGDVVWQWRAYEHLDPELDVACPLVNRIMWPYINSVWICADGNILLSLRYVGEGIKIAYPSGEVLARYGRGKMSFQHDCRELDNGNILFFDNGDQRQDCNSPSYSQVVEIDPATDEVVWSYQADPPWSFYVASCSGSERLPNGNTLICESWPGRLFEVTPEREIVWEFISPFAGRWADRGMDSNMIWRAHRYAPDYAGLQGKELDPARLPWENQTYGPTAWAKDFRPLIF